MYMRYNLLVFFYNRLIAVHYVHVISSCTRCTVDNFLVCQGNSWLVPVHGVQRMVCWFLYIMYKLYGSVHDLHLLFLCTRYNFLGACAVNMQ